MSKSKSAAVASGSPRCLPRFRSPFAEHDERTGEAGGRGADEAAAAAVSLRLPKATTATAAGPTWACWAALAQAIVGGLLPPLSPLLCFALRRHPPLPFFHRSDRTIAAGVHLRRHGGNKPRAGGEARHLNFPRRRGTEAKTSSMCFQSERKKAPQELLPRRR